MANNVWPSIDSNFWIVDHIVNTFCHIFSLPHDSWSYRIYLSIYIIYKGSKKFNIYLHPHEKYGLIKETELSLSINETQVLGTGIKYKSKLI